MKFNLNQKKIYKLIKVTLFFFLIIFSFSFYFFLSRLEKKYETTQVLIASENLEAHTTLKSSNFKKTDFPRMCVPSNSISRSEEVEGKILSQFVKEGTPLTKDHLAKPGNPDSISIFLPNDRWAFNLSSKDLSAPLPKIAKGDYIEIVTAQAGTPFEQNGVIVSQVPILDLEEKDDETIITLALLEEEARKLLYAQANRFSINLMIRPFGI
jgi:Flp pilus assembly protein CpaB